MIELIGLMVNRINSPVIRFQFKKRYSMEGSGMDIVSMSRKLGMTYNAGDKKVVFFMMMLY